MLTNTDGELDKVFNNKTSKEMENKRFTPQMPLKLRASRSVIIFNVDSHIPYTSMRKMK